ncbi:MAG: ribosome biogenesis GTP-binding protein YihA/YsxC [Rickettsiales bacterium]
METRELTRALFLKPVHFVAGVATLEQFPELNLPEVALIGRSNVGKSSLINALVNHGSLARTSQTPGATRQLNFFNLSDMFHLVDVPGYGYAKASKTDVAKWQGLLFDYLRGRRQLARAFVLVDARHGVKKADDEMFKMLDDAAVSYQFVLTKIDKVTAAELAQVQARTLEAARARPAAHPGLVSTSASAKQGIDELRDAVIEALIGK